MTSPETGGDFDRDSWDRRWSQALREGAHAVAQRPPNAHLLAEVADLRPGRPLDASAGHGAETLWLAARGWRVTAVDFSTTVLEHARSRAEGLGADVAERIDWIAAATGAPTPADGQVQVSVDSVVAALEPAAGRSSSPRTVRVRWPAAAAAPWCAPDGLHDQCARSKRRSAA